MVACGNLDSPVNGKEHGAFHGKKLLDSKRVHGEVYEVLSGWRVGDVTVFSYKSDREPFRLERR